MFANTIGFNGENFVVKRSLEDWEFVKLGNLIWLCWESGVGGYILISMGCGTKC